MNKKLFFLFLLVFFLITTPCLVFYSWGYRFDFETMKIVKTGAFYFRVVPKNVKIYLAPIEKGNVNREKEIIKKTDFFFGAVLIENLLPKKYEVEIRKENFHSWKKTLEIKENQVVEAKNIILFPKELNYKSFLKNIEDFFPSPEGKILILKENIEDETENSAIAFKNNFSFWSLKTLETETNIITKVINSQDISKDKEVKFLDLKFSFDSKKILLKTEVDQKIRYFFIDLTVSPIKTLSLDFLSKETKDIFFHPTNDQKLLIFEKESISEIDLSENKISLVEILKNIKPINTFNKKFYYLDKEGFLFKDNFSQKEKINNSPFQLKDNVQKLEINNFPNALFLKDDQKLYFLDQSTGSFQFLFETTKEPKISPDNKKILYFSDYEIWILFLKNELNHLKEKLDQKLFISRFSEKINNAFFFNNNYLIFNVGDKIKIAEIDDRDVINIIDLAEFKSPKIFWQQNLNVLFVLSEGKIYLIKKIVS